MNSDRPPKPAVGPAIWAIIVIVVGVILLLEQLEILPFGFVIHFWPLVLVLAGLAKLLSSDQHLWGPVLILAGVVLQLNEMGITHLSIWNLWPVLIIVAGLAGLWQALQLSPIQNATGNSQFDLFYVFGGGERKVNTKNFQGGRIFAIFGGYKVDLTRADIEGSQAVLEANAVFGGGEILVPENWIVMVQGVGIFGAYDDKSRHLQTDPSSPAKTLIIKGVAVFGGIEVKN
jgi:predicted membrane protein